MRFTIILSLLLSWTFAFAQTPQNGRFGFYKKIAEAAPGMQITYEATHDEVEEALASRLREATNKSLDKVKGDLFVHEGLVVPSISPQTLDYYFRIEEMNGQRTGTRVTLFLALGNDNFMDQSTYPDEWSAARTFLTTLNETIVGDQLSSALAEMEDALKAAEKELEDLKGKSKDLKKQQEKLEEELEQVITDRTTNQQALEKQEQVVEDLREQIEALNRQSGN